MVQKTVDVLILRNRHCVMLVLIITVLQRFFRAQKTIACVSTNHCQKVLPLRIGQVFPTPCVEKTTSLQKQIQMGKGFIWGMIMITNIAQCRFVWLHSSTQKTTGYMPYHCLTPVITPKTRQIIVAGIIMPVLTTI